MPLSNRSLQVEYNSETREMTLRFQLEKDPPLSSKGKSYLAFSTGGYLRLSEVNPNVPALYQVSMNVIELRREKLNPDASKT